VSLDAATDARGDGDVQGDGEPPLSELLADPILHLLMAGDGISLAESDA
jgi:hypothetical protein